MEPILQFEGYQIEKIVYEKNVENKEENDIKVEVSTGLSQDKDKGQVQVTVKTFEKEEKRKLELSVAGFFMFSNINDDEKSKVLAINGTAILYPYVRAIASVVTSQDTNPAIILPTVNTLNFLKNEVINLDE